MQYYICLVELFSSLRSRIIFIYVIKKQLCLVIAIISQSEEHIFPLYICIQFVKFVPNLEIDAPVEFI